LKHLVKHPSHYIAKSFVKYFISRQAEFTFKINKRAPYQLSFKGELEYEHLIDTDIVDDVKTSPTESSELVLQLQGDDKVEDPLDTHPLTRNILNTPLSQRPTAAKRLLI
jgi:hypothetical protein